MGRKMKRANKNTKKMIVRLNMKAEKRNRMKRKK